MPEDLPDKALCFMRPYEVSEGPKKDLRVPYVPAHAHRGPFKALYDLMKPDKALYSPVGPVDAS